MKLVYSRRASADLTGIAAYYSTNASQAVAQSIERRFLEVTERVHRAPESAPRVEQRPEVAGCLGDPLSVSHILSRASRLSRNSAYSAHVEAAGHPEIGCATSPRSLHGEVTGL